MKLKRIVSRGFKGAEFAYDLDKPLCLFGDNGAGKSRVLQAIHYALSGEVPTGKALDAVALFFPPRGGTVTLELENGEKVTRGIVVDAEKKKNSEFLSFDGEPASFLSSAAVLDIRNFLELSPNLRREFIMELVETATDGVNLIAAVSHQFAQEIGGKAATAQWLHKEKAPIPLFFFSNHGIHQHLMSLRIDGLSLGGVCNFYLEEAKGLKLAARKRAGEAKAAIREMEPEAKAAENMAKALPAAREAEIALSDKVKLHLERIKRMEELKKVADERQERVLSLQAKKSSIEVQALSLEAAGDLPTPPAEIDNLRKLNEEIQEGEKQGKGLEQLIDAWQDLQVQAKGYEEGIAEAEDILGKIAKQPVTALSHLLDSFQDSLHPEMRKAKALAREAAAVELEDFRACSDNISDMQEKLELVKAKLPVAFNAAQDAKTALQQLEKNLEKDKAIYSEMFTRTGKAQRDYAEAVRTRDARLTAARANERLMTDLDTQIRLAGEEYEKADSAFADAIRALEEGPEAADDPSDLVERLKQATGAREAAEKAGGAWEAYQKAIESARAAQVEEEAWKLAEVAIKSVREEYVGDTAAGLIQDLTDYWRSSGRQEIPYLLLESERGKPIFELGLLRGEERIALGALSEGEQLLFTISLAYTICKRDKGLKPLLIEADPLQHNNLTDLMAWLERNRGSFDAVVVAKGGEFADCLPPGFEVIYLQ